MLVYKLFELKVLSRPQALAACPEESEVPAAMTQEQTALQFQKMTQTPIPRLILTLAGPTILSMLITSIYNLADTFFVGQLSTSASGAVGVVSSLMAIIQALGFMLGHGAGSIISRSLGQRDTETASRFASTSFFTASTQSSSSIWGMARRWLETLRRLKFSSGRNSRILPSTP